MSSGTACVTGCEVVSKLGLSKGHAGKTRCLNLSAVNPSARFTLADPARRRDLRLAHPAGSSAGVSAAVGGVGAPGGPQGMLLACSPASLAPGSRCRSLALPLALSSRGVTRGSFFVLGDTLVRGRVSRQGAQPRLPPELCRGGPGCGHLTFPRDFFQAVLRLGKSSLPACRDAGRLSPARQTVGEIP